MLDSCTYSQENSAKNVQLLLLWKQHRRPPASSFCSCSLFVDKKDLEIHSRSSYDYLSHYIEHRNSNFTTIYLPRMSFQDVSVLDKCYHAIQAEWRSANGWWAVPEQIRIWLTRNSLTLFAIVNQVDKLKHEENTPYQYVWFDSDALRHS